MVEALEAHPLLPCCSQPHCDHSWNPNFGSALDDDWIHLQVLFYDSIFFLAISFAVVSSYSEIIMIIFPIKISEFQLNIPTFKYMLGGIDAHTLSEWIGYWEIQINCSKRTYRMLWLHGIALFSFWSPN